MLSVFPYECEDRPSRLMVRKYPCWGWYIKLCVQLKDRLVLSLFNDTFSTASLCRLLCMMSYKGCVTKRIICQDIRYRTEIWTPHLQSTKQEWYPLHYSVLYIKRHGIYSVPNFAISRSVLGSEVSYLTKLFVLLPSSSRQISEYSALHYVRTAFKFSILNKHC
jgi:hypothetical protein